MNSRLRPTLSNEGLFLRLVISKLAPFMESRSAELIWDPSKSRISFETSWLPRRFVSIV